MANTPTGTGNTPTGNPGAGTHETTSAPDPVVTTAAPATTGSPSSGTAVVDGNISTTELSDADYKKDGNLRADAIRRIEDNAPPRSGTRSYNEVTDETTVTTVVGGQTVTFVQLGDTRGPTRETAMDSLARASENSEENE